MNRKISLIFILVLYILIGIAGLVYVFTNGTISKPEKSTIESSQVSVSKLEPPKEASGDAPSFEGLESYDDFFESDDAANVVEEFPADVATADDLFSTSDAQDSLDADEQQYTFVATHDRGRLFIRDTPSMEGNIIGHMYRGQKGEVIKNGDEWIYATYKDVTGYISKQYVELIPVEKTE